MVILYVTHKQHISINSILFTLLLPLMQTGMRRGRNVSIDI